MTADLSCLGCPYCHDDDEALYCYAETCIRERGGIYAHPTNRTRRRDLLPFYPLVPWWRRIIKIILGGR